MRLEIEDLTVDYGDARAVDGLSFGVDDGGLICLLGPSGCGKSTVLNSVAGFVRPSTGRIFFDGRDVTETRTEDRDIGMVFQNYSLYPHMTVRENIAFPLRIRRRPKQEINERVEGIAELTRISGILERKPGEISGGQQQRVAISRALVKNPALLLLDEPLSNLDARLRLEMRGEIRRIQKDTGTTTLFVTHDQEEAMSISDRIILLNAGRMQQNDIPRRLYEAPANMFAAKFLGSPPINIIKARCSGSAMEIGGGILRLETDMYKEGSEYLLGIRCEDISLCRSDEKPDATAEFISFELLGKDAVVSARLGTDLLRFLVPCAQTDGLCGDISIRIRRGGVHVFDMPDVDSISARADTGRRIGGLL